MTKLSRETLALKASTIGQALDPQWVGEAPLAKEMVCTSLQVSMSTHVEISGLTTNYGMQSASISFAQRHNRTDVLLSSCVYCQQTQ